MNPAEAVRNPRIRLLASAMFFGWLSAAVCPEGLSAQEPAAASAGGAQEAAVQAAEISQTRDRRPPPLRPPVSTETIVEVLTEPPKIDTHGFESENQDIGLAAALSQDRPPCAWPSRGAWER